MYYNYDETDAFLEGYSDALIEMMDDDDYEDAYLEGYYTALDESNSAARAKRRNVEYKSAGVKRLSNGNLSFGDRKKLSNFRKTNRSIPKTYKAFGLKSGNTGVIERQMAGKTRRHSSSNYGILRSDDYRNYNH